LENVVAVRAVCDAPFDLTQLEEAARQRLDRRAVARAGLTSFDTDRDYTARLHTALGIGTGGDGYKAVGLLGRIQAGQQITTVDALYKTMVLEEPTTFASADGAVQHFDELSATHDRMVTAQQQVNALAPIREHRASIDAAAARLDLIDSVGDIGDGSSPAAAWAAGRRLALLSQHEADLQRSHARAKQEAAELAAAASSARLERDAARELLAEAGGGRLTRAQQEIDRLTGRLETVQDGRARLDDLARAVGRSITSRAEHDAALAEALGRLGDTSSRDAVRNQFADARASEQAARAAVTELRREHEAARAWKDAIPADLHRVREVLAEAAGLSPSELPFVGELVEVVTEFEPWRDAFNLALGGFATEMLVDVAHLQHFRSAINAVPTARRVRFRGVPTGVDDDVVLAERTLPSRLELRRSPFTGWLRGELAARFSYVCVDAANQLGQHPKAVTVTGQTSDGARGAHGGQGVRNVLGFTGSRRLKALQAQIAEAEARFEAASAELVRVQADLDQWDDRRTAYSQLVTLAWDDADVDAVRAELDRWTTILDEVASQNPQIGQLRAQVVALDEKVTDLTERNGVAKNQVNALAELWEQTTDAVDAAQRLLDETEDTQVSVEQQEYLVSLVEDGQVHDSAPGPALERLDASLRRAASTLKEDRLAAQTAAAAGLKALQRIFETFKERWPNPNLGVDPEASFPDFERILDDLQTQRLHELQSQWRESLLRLSGADLTTLDSDISTAVRDIRDRIDPINTILDGLDFSDDQHTLHIVARDSVSPVRAQFRSDLRAVREVIANATTEDDRLRAYSRLAGVIDRIRRTAPEFHDLIDVRNHVRISAEKLTKSGEHVAVYDHIGEKSGGESQELVAFIVGAALRYQLGDGGAERPRYAPVFLDEALIKADAYFTGRAIRAWRGLGFQLIISAPNDKHSGIEPHVDASYVVLKGPDGRSFATPMVALPETNAEA
jgi:uncharacterized protein YPO0396